MFGARSKQYQQNEIPSINMVDEDVETKRVFCNSDVQCEQLINITTANSMVFCDKVLRICIVGVLNDHHEEDHDDDDNDGDDQDKKDDDDDDTDADDNKEEHMENYDQYSNFSFPVWIAFTIPFILIILVGIFCGKKLKEQERNIENNLLRSTIHGVHVDHILSTHEILQSIASSSPPPTYEKATGEIPPSYETVLQVLEERRLSILDCEMVNKPLISEQSTPLIQPSSSNTVLLTVSQHPVSSTQTL